MTISIHREVHRDQFGRVVPTPPEPCVDCGRLMLGRHARRALPPAERRKFAMHTAGGRCNRCYRRHRGEYAGHESRWTTDDLAYEWEFLQRQGYTRAQAAQRLHVSYNALCKAISRAEARTHTDREDVAA